ncbi:MAG TPA: heme ABC transporter ATP-binding protein [Puia sp.]|jgi:iron complex transport system ATP-binding protein
MLEIRDLVCKVGSRTIVDGVSLSFDPGRLHVIVGPNGSGKSTLLKAFSGEWVPSSGCVTYDGADLARIGKLSIARRRAVMTQLPELHFPLSVDEIVMMGRYPHFSFSPAPNDRAICAQVMSHLSIQSLSGRDYLTLSGGERQRVQFARALAQIWEAPHLSAGLPPSGSRYLFLDEPVSSLDIHYQHQFLQLARDLVKENIVLIAILHDLNLALHYADRMIFMKQGRIVAEGAVPGIVTPALIREVFDIEARLLEDPESDTPVITFNHSSNG